MEIKQTTSFQFVHVVGDITYNFNVTADSRESAIMKLAAALNIIVSELQQASKAATKAS